MNTNNQESAYSFQNINIIRPLNCYSIILHSFPSGRLCPDSSHPFLLNLFVKKDYNLKNLSQDCKCIIKGPLMKTFLIPNITNNTPHCRQALFEKFCHAKKQKIYYIKDQ